MSTKWIGLAKVRPHKGSDVFGPQPSGAIVNIIACADDANEFHDVAVRAFEEYELELVKLEDIEPLASRVAAYEVDATLLRDAERIPEDTPFVFSSFHTYPLD